MASHTAYIICGTPRSGSTLLCEMLWASRVAGRPNSYFRKQDVAQWADTWGVPRPHGVDNAEFDRAYLAAMIRHGTAETRIFGLRIMWASMGDAAERLARASGPHLDMGQQFALAFGQPLYVHVTRRDKVAQAISRLRAEQSGVWHLLADGNILEGTQQPQAVAYDRDRIAGFVAELMEHDAAWEKFFAARQIEPLCLEYEATAADPQAALRTILKRLGHGAEIADIVSVPTAMMRDDTSVEWARRFRLETGVQ